MLRDFVWIGFMVYGWCIGLFLFLVSFDSWLFGFRRIISWIPVFQRIFFSVLVLFNDLYGFGGYLGGTGSILDSYFLSCSIFYGWR